MLVFFAGLASAQTGALSGPVAGYVYDRGAQSLRPIAGLLGAATVGAPIDAGYSLTAAYVSPRQDSFFGIAADGSTHYFTLASGLAAEKVVAGLPAAPQRVIFSPSGTAAALYSRGEMNIVTGLPASPALSGNIKLLEPAERRAQRAPGAMALSDDGAYLLADINGSLELATPNTGMRPVLRASVGAVAAFAPGGHDAAIAASGTGAILIRDVAGAAAQQPLASDGPAFDPPAGIAFSSDGKRIFVASASQKSVAVLDLAGNRTDLTCSCSPTELTPMGASFRLSELSTDPLWLVDAGAAGPRVVFVPALRAAQ